jgi:hypothetical protein
MIIESLAPLLLVTVLPLSLTYHSSNNNNITCLELSFTPTSNNYSEYRIEPSDSEHQAHAKYDSEEVRTALTLSTY